MENQETIVTENQAQESETRDFTTEDIQALLQSDIGKAFLQSETDRRVTAALKTQQKKFDKQLSLAKLDDEAREKAEKDDRIKELEGQLAEFQIEKNKSEIKSIMASRGLDPRLADLVIITDDLEESQRRIELLDKIVKENIRAGVEGRLAASGSTPKGNGTAAPLTKENLLKMNVAELQAFKAKNPELYKSLINN
jgi:hypothetical protein